MKTLKLVEIIIDRLLDGPVILSGYSCIYDIEKDTISITLMINDPFQYHHNEFFIQNIIFDNSKKTITLDTTILGEYTMVSDIFFNNYWVKIKQVYKNTNDELDTEMYSQIQNLFQISDAEIRKHTINNI